MKTIVLISIIVFGLISCSSAKPIPTKPMVTNAQPEVAKPQPEAPKDTESWRLMQPKVGPSPDVVIPIFKQATLPNGLTVIVAERSTLPLVSVSLVLRSGSAVESAKEQGLADLTYETMMEGAGKKDGVALAEAFADLGTQMHVQTAEDGAAFKALLLKKNLDAGIELMAEILTKPSFKKDDFARKQKERLSDLQSLLGRPAYLSSIATSTRIFGDTHPYGHPVMGTAESVASFTRKHLKNFYRKNVSPQNTALILAGDITLDEAITIATAKLNSWKHKTNIAQFTPSSVEKDKLPAFSLAMVAKPGMNQTIISAGSIALPVGHPDEWALRVAISAFGGMFGSRLNMNLREDKGYTYGARGHLDAMFQEGATILSTSVRADVTGASLAEIIAELDKLKSRPLTDLEFHSATENVLKSVSGWFDSVSGLGTAAQSIFLRQVPLTRYADMVAAYQLLTIEDVHRAATTYLDKSFMQVVLVGDPNIIKEQLADLSLGEPVLLELE